MRLTLDFGELTQSVALRQVPGDCLLQALFQWPFRLKAK